MTRTCLRPGDAVWYSPKRDIWRRGTVVAVIRRRILVSLGSSVSSPADAVKPRHVIRRES